MRIWGRIFAGDGTWTWNAVETAPDGSNDYVLITNLCQVLKLNLNESPFYANYGIPAQQSVIQQVFPDYYVAITQAQFAGFFASLIVAKVESATPFYRINLTTNQGVQVAADVPV